jgi:hypothetical protein
MRFEGQSTSVSQEICNSFVIFISRTYAWIPLDPGPDFVKGEPPFGFFQFAISDVENEQQVTRPQRRSITVYEKLCFCVSCVTLSAIQ